MTMLQKAALKKAAQKLKAMSEKEFKEYIKDIDSIFDTLGIEVTITRKESN